VRRVVRPVERFFIGALMAFLALLLERRVKSRLKR
jgi:hypothetical protein